DPRRPTDARGLRAAELLHQPVVAPAAAERALGAQLGALELEHGPRVVVEPAYERPVDLVRLTGGVEQGAHLREMVGVLRVDAVEQPRRVGERRLGPWVVRVERPERIAVEAGPHIVRKEVLAGAQVLAELVGIGAPGLR